MENIPCVPVDGAWEILDQVQLAFKTNITSTQALVEEATGLCILPDASSWKDPCEASEAACIAIATLCIDSLAAHGSSRKVCYKAGPRFSLYFAMPGAVVPTPYAFFVVHVQMYRTARLLLPRRLLLLRRTRHLPMTTSRRAHR